MPHIRSLVLQDAYRDSIFLMKISSAAGALEGIALASAMMATDRNKDLFRHSGLMTPEIEAARQDDLAVSVMGAPDATESMLDAAMQEVAAMLAGSAKAKGKGASYQAAGLDGALAQDPALNMALISVPGEYAAYESAKALSSGLNVMLYSDNVPLEDERRLKEYAVSRGLLLMGPDCGTAIINGVPLAFANTVRRGGIGVIGASGTGMQEVTSLIHMLGQGVSHCIGVGGRDLKEAIGGLTTKQAFALLQQDADTKVIVLVAKPPAPAVRAELCRLFGASPVPVVIFYAGADAYDQEQAAGIATAKSLEETAVLAVAALVGKDAAHKAASSALTDAPEAAAVSAAIPSGRKWLRGIFGGGSLAYEAMHLASASLAGSLYANTPLPGVGQLEDVENSREHSILDMGDDQFTVGKPHPMIDPTQKLARMLRELCDPQTAVLLFDVVIGHGSYPDLAAAIAKTLEEAAQKSGGKSREVALITSVCGTDEDSPSRAAQEAALRAAGVTVCASNARAAALAVSIISGLKEKR